MEYELKPIGVIRSALTSREAAPRQGHEGAPEAWIEIDPAMVAGLEGIVVGSEILVITWFHLAQRERLQVHRRGDTSQPATGVFSTRSPDRPNPLGLHPVTVLAISGNKLQVKPLEAIDGTPVVDIKPVIS